MTTGLAACCCGLLRGVGVAEVDGEDEVVSKVDEAQAEPGFACCSGGWSDSDSIFDQCVQYVETEQTQMNVLKKRRERCAELERQGTRSWWRFEVVP